MEIPHNNKASSRISQVTGYYCKFVKNYGRIKTPLTSILKKDAFYWTPEVANAFEHLKQEMCQAPALATLHFTNFFIVECDASRNGIGAILIQEGRPIAFGSCPIKEIIYTNLFMRRK